MAELKVIYFDEYTESKYKDDFAYWNVIQYCFDRDKMLHDCYGAYGVDMKHAGFEMQLLAQSYSQDRGLRLRHFILTFSGEELTSFAGPYWEEMTKIADYVARYYADSYQIVYVIHEASMHIHIHFVMSTVNYRTGKKYRGNKKDYYDFQKYLARYLRENYGFYLITLSDGPETKKYAQKHGDDLEREMAHKKAAMLKYEKL